MDDFKPSVVTCHTPFLQAQSFCQSTGQTEKISTDPVHLSLSKCLISPSPTHSLCNGICAAEGPAHHPVCISSAVGRRYPLSFPSTAEPTPAGEELRLLLREAFVSNSQGHFKKCVGGRTREVYFRSMRT